MHPLKKLLLAWSSFWVVGFTVIIVQNTRAHQENVDDLREVEGTVLVNSGGSGSGGSHVLVEYGDGRRWECEGSTGCGVGLPGETVTLYVSRSDPNRVYAAKSVYDDKHSPAVLGFAASVFALGPWVAAYGLRLFDKWDADEEGSRMLER